MIIFLKWDVLNGGLISISFIPMDYSMGGKEICDKKSLSYCDIVFADRLLIASLFHFTSAIIFFEFIVENTIDQ